MIKIWKICTIIVFIVRVIIVVVIIILLVSLFTIIVGLDCHFEQFIILLTYFIIMFRVYFI